MQEVRFPGGWKISRKRSSKNLRPKGKEQRTSSAIQPSVKSPQTKGKVTLGSWNRCPGAKIPRKNSFKQTARKKKGPIEKRKAKNSQCLAWRGSWHPEAEQVLKGAEAIKEIGPFFREEMKVTRLLR